MPELPIPIEITFPQQLVDRIAGRIAQMIRERTRRGIDKDGNAFQAYGTKPFARPLGGITARARKNLGENLQTFTTRQGQLWALIIGGYAAYKKAAFPGDGDGVNLTATGGMLRSLSVLEARSDGTIIIGFNRQDAAEIAYYHAESGAGRSRVKRDFMGLTDAEMTELADMAARGAELE